MRLLNFASRFEEPSALTTERLLLRRPVLSDFSSWASLRRESVDFLQPYEPAWTADELSRSAFKARLRRQEAEITSGRGLPWFLFLKSEPKTLVGGFTISNIRRGVAQTGTLGYWIGETLAGQGYGHEALLAICGDAFNVHKLHRLEAATVLDNERSMRLLISCGFQKEGTARQYLKINGQWRDHHLFARLKSDRLQ